MGKTIRKISSLILTVILLAVFSACAGKDTKADIMQDRAGTYELSSIVRDGQETPAEDLALLKEKGLKCTITLEADGSGVLDLFGEQQKVSWDTETITADGKVRTYTCQNDQLTLINDDSRLMFIRSSDH